MPRLNGEFKVLEKDEDILSAIEAKTLTHNWQSGKEPEG